jgi:hypothetical protein
MQSLLGRLLVLLLLCSAGPARAAQVFHLATDLPDEPEAGDRWLYEYALDEFPYDAGWGFSVFFDPALYAALEVATPGPGPAWDPITLEPDAGLGAFGVYDAEALVDAPPVGAVFRVRFEWLGLGTPGEQPFEVRDPSLAVVASGTTLLPEPAALWLEGGAIAALLRLRAPRRSRC